MVPVPDETPAYRAVLVQAFRLAHHLGCRCGPVHLLAAVSESPGPVAAALVLPGGAPLRSAVTAADGVPGGAATYVNLQAQEAARGLAHGRGEPVGIGHLAVVLIDQAAPDTVGLLTRAGIDAPAVRRLALEAIGAPSDLPAVDLPPLVPAGTLDRPPLGLAELDGRAWAALSWRQDHLPLHRLRRSGDWSALHHLELKAAWRVASRLDLDDDQRYSLYRHHGDRVEARAVAARPDLFHRRHPPDGSGPPARFMGARLIKIHGRRRRPHRLSRVLSFTVGWGSWFSNRRVGLRNRWFRLRTWPAYRGAPRLGH